MSQADWQQVKEVFYIALKRPVSERSAFLDSACGHNPSLRSEVDVLLDSYDSGFLESPLLTDKDSNFSPSEPLFEQGKTFSQYKIIKLLGRGGMGEVYLANDTALDRLTAIKIIHNDSGFGDQAAGRLIREARAAARLNHPNICSVYEGGETDGQPFIAMQYLEGEMLDTLIERDSISFDDAVAYARQIAAALAAAHASGIVHRDIKPSNIIIDSRKHLKVLDFGLAKETHPNSTDKDASAIGLIAGTVTYMSPEHVRGMEINAQTDIWSLGVVFYQMLTGRLPFRGATKADLISDILNNDPIPPGDLIGTLPAAFNYILDRALQKDRADRYASIERFDTDLAEIIETGSVRDFSKVPLRAVPATVSVSRSDGLFMRLALPALLLLILIGGGFGVWRFQVAPGAAQSFSANYVGSMQIASLYDVKQSVSGVVTDLSFSPDGRHIAFAMSGKVNRGVHVQSLAGGEPFRVTDGNAIDYSPVWSPDGQRLAYLSFRDGTISLWSVSYFGGEAKHLLELGKSGTVYQLRKWSNDGSKIFFEYGEGPMVIDLKTGSITTVDLTGIQGKPSRDFSVSPDESKLLIPTINDGKENLWVKFLDNTNARLISTTIERNGGLNWFPDSHRFTYSSHKSGVSQIYTGSIDGGPPEQITFDRMDSHSPVVSPDGQRMLFMSNTGEANLFKTNIESQKETSVTANLDMNLLPRISPDGRRIAYATVPHSTRFIDGKLKIEPYGNDGVNEKIQLGRPGCCAEWSPNGDKIAFVRRAGSLFEIWTAAANGDDENQITSGGVVMPGFSIAPANLRTSFFNWSPDGSKIVYASKKSGQENIYTSTVNGSDETKLTNFHDGMTKAINPIWSPDGDKIAFVEATTTGYAPSSNDNSIAIHNKGSISVIGKFETNILLLTRSNNGKNIYAAVAGKKYYDICILNAQVSNTKTCMARLHDAIELGISISPDQKWVVYTKRIGQIDNIFLASLDGLEPKQLTANNDSNIFYSGVTWSPDSKTLLYSKQSVGMRISLMSNEKKERD